jgi:hypothetical protein
MYQNRAMIEGLAREHDSEMYGRARRRAAISRRRPAGSTRTRAGWLLIGLGMRLLAGHGRAATHLNVAAGS